MTTAGETKPADSKSSKSAGSAPGLLPQWFLDMRYHQERLFNFGRCLSLLMGDKQVLECFGFADTAVCNVATTCVFAIHQKAQPIRETMSKMFVGGSWLEQMQKAHEIKTFLASKNTFIASEESIKLMLCDADKRQAETKKWTESAIESLDAMLDCYRQAAACVPENKKLGDAVRAHKVHHDAILKQARETVFPNMQSDAFAEKLNDIGGQVKRMTSADDYIAVWKRYCDVCTVAK